MLELAEKDSFITVTVDKSHIITIGERLYTESIELIRELVNNAYDANATHVEVEIREDEIMIRDNGLGMDLRGLKQYFNIGSSDTMHIARLVTQEITLMKNPSTARQAFLRQSRLLKDAFADMEPTPDP